MTYQIIEVTDTLTIAYDAREWCKLPYPNHPRGCPNYGKRFTCPPQAPFITFWLGGATKLWFVCVGFDIKEWANRMLLKHPHWTDRQARCLLYWQPKVNKELQEATYQFASRKGSDCVLKGVTYCPEAMGVNVIETAQRQGLPIQANPQDTIYKISLVVI